MTRRVSELLLGTEWGCDETAHDRSGSGEGVCRPSIPWTLYLAISVASGTFLAEEMSWRFAVYADSGTGARSGMQFVDKWAIALPPRAMGPLLLCLAVIVGLLTMLCSSGRRGRGAPLVAMLLSAFLLATGSGMLHWDGWFDDVSQLDGMPADVYRVEITGDSLEGTSGARSDAMLHLSSGSIPCTVFWGSGVDPVPAGYLLETYGTFQSAGLDGRGRTQHRKGVCGTVTVHQHVSGSPARSPVGRTNVFREEVAGLLAGIGGGGSGIVRGVVLGDRRGLRAEGVESSFRTAGVSHLIAVSGSHLAIVAALFEAVFSRVLSNRMVRTMALCLLLGGYVVLTGFQISAIRSLVMTVGMLAAPILGRRGHSLSAVSLAFALIVLVSPESLFSLSLQLSAAAVFGIALLSSYVASWVRTVIPVLPASVVQALSLTLSAQMATIPISVPAFSQLSIIAPISNLVAAPLVSAVLVVGVSILPICAVLPGAISSSVLEIPCLFGNITVEAVEWMADIPLASVPVVWSGTVTVPLCTLLVLVLWLVWPTPSKRAGRLMLVFACGVLVSFVAVRMMMAGPQIVMLDVGQGDAMLVSSGRHAVLVDTGPADGGVSLALARNSTFALDAVIVTHLHDDHYGDLESLDAMLSDGIVCFADDEMGRRYRDHEALVMARGIMGDDRVMGISVGDTLSFDGFTIEVLAPERLVEAGGNADSICLLVSWDADDDGHPEFRMLTTGDAEAGTIAGITDEVGDIDVIKVGHHGSAGSLDEPLLETLAPELALISVGRGNRFGHPDPETLSKLEDRGIPVMRTDEDGDIRLVLGGRGWSMV